MDEAWSRVLLQLRVEEMLCTRQVCKEWKENFALCLTLLCTENDLHPCRTTKEFITALAHTRGCWRRVPSLSRLQNKSFASTRLVVALRQLFTTNEIYAGPVDTQTDWTSLTDAELTRKLLALNALCGHSFLLQIYSTIKKRSLAMQYAVFAIFVQKGVAPYYLDLFLSRRLFATRLSGRQYLTLIVNERCEYLLKRELRAKRTLAIPEDWERGRAISAKYKKRRGDAYKK